MRFSRALVFVIVCTSVSQSLASDLIVAVVETEAQTIRISLERLNAYLADHSQLTASLALEELIEFELLAAGAEKSALHLSEETSIASAKTMVALYLKEHFEPLWTRETIPEEMLQSSYRRNRGIFNHPELRKAVHVVVTQKSKFPEDPKIAAEAKRIADRVSAEFSARPPTTQAEFTRRARHMKDWGKSAGLQVDLQDLHRFAQKGRYSSSFTGAVFAHSTPKVVLPVFKTEFGYHIVWIEAVTPARSDTFETVRAELLERVTPEVRSMKLIALTDQLANQYPAINRGVGVRRLMNPTPLRVLELDAAP